jgi:hypothetical protein
MKTATTIIAILTFLLACGQVNQEKSVLIETAKDTQKENDIAKLWVKEIKSQSYFKQLDENSIEIKNLDISNILAYNYTTKNEVSGHFSTYTGALGQNFERIDFHFYSVSKVGNQDYDMKILMRKGTVIDTLIGRLKLIEALEFPELFSDENMKAMTFLYDFNFVSKNPDGGLTIKGTSSVSFYVSDGIARNFWMEDGSLREYIRTFVGYYIDSKTDEKLNCVFALDAAGLYSYLPFCDDFYYIDEENYSPDYYLIKEKYRQFGWQEYDYKNPNKDEWWRE